MKLVLLLLRLLRLLRLVVIGGALDIKSRKTVEGPSIWMPLKYKITFYINSQTSKIKRSKQKAAIVRAVDAKCLRS